MKLKLASLSAIILSIVILSSCTKQNNDTSIDDFKNDKLLANITGGISDYKTAMASNNIPAIKKSLDVFVSSSKMLYSKYGENNVEKYFKILIAEEIQSKNNSTVVGNLLAPGSGGGGSVGDKCHRNANGTVNADDCNFWENIAVAVSSAVHCTQPGTPATPSEIQSYYNCVQERVCLNC
jgi:hypothetical protein